MDVFTKKGETRRSLPSSKIVRLNAPARISGDWRQYVALALALIYNSGTFASYFQISTPSIIRNNGKSFALVSTLAVTYTGYILYQYKKQQEIREQARNLYNTAKKDRLYVIPHHTESTAIVAVHGMWSSQDLADLCVYSPNNEVGFILPDTPVIAFNFPDASTDFALIAKTHYLEKRHLTNKLTAAAITEQDWERIRVASLAQEEDIRHLEQVVLSDRAQQHHNLILAGVSRGAATIINYMGSKVPPTNIKALILDAPFDAIYDVLYARLKLNNLHMVPLLTTILDFYGTYYFKNYSTCGIRPIDVVDCIPNIPTLMICSLEDTIVPPRNTMRLYKKLIEDGRTNVHLFITPYGEHGRIMYDAQHPESGFTYRNVVHAFLQTYTLEHEPTWATAGHEAFAACQPSVKYLSKTYGI